MSIAYLTQPEQQQQLEWLDGGTLAILLDGKATTGQLMTASLNAVSAEQKSRPRPLTMMSSATAGAPLSVEKTTRSPFASYAPIRAS